MFRSVLGCSIKKSFFFPFFFCFVLGLFVFFSTEKSRKQPLAAFLSLFRLCSAGWSLERENSLLSPPPFLPLTRPLCLQATPLPQRSELGSERVDPLWSHTLSHILWPQAISWTLAATCSSLRARRVQEGGGRDPLKRGSSALTSKKKKENP